MRHVEFLLLVLSWLAFTYFVVLNVFNIVFTIVATRRMTTQVRSRTYAATTDAFASPLTPGISVVVAAFNEQAGIVECVRSLLALRYPRHEVIVVNDGSTDATMSLLQEEFGLVAVPRVLRGAISYMPIRATYLSQRAPGLCVIDKENGGRADALNAGIDVACHPYVCAIDADSLLDEDALLLVAKPILDDPGVVVATGGTIRIANGCRVDHGRVVEVSIPSNRLATFQVLEYLRGFLVGRVGWSSLNALTIISGAFGLFHRPLIEAVGGYSTETVTEDLDLVIRMHRHLREHGKPYRIETVAAPVCWTEAPEDFRTLSRQRRRWQRGLGQALWAHRGMIGNPRYGAVGMLGMPFLLTFEFLGAAVEIVGTVATFAAFGLGLLSVWFLILFLVLSVMLGAVLSVAALTLEEFSLRRNARGRDAARLLAYGVLESFGYRLLIALWRTLALVDLARRKKGWGEQRRRGIGARPACDLPLAAITTEDHRGSTIQKGSPVALGRLTQQHDNTPLVGIAELGATSGTEVNTDADVLSDSFRVEVGGSAGVNKLRSEVKGIPGGEDVFARPRRDDPNTTFPPLSDLGGVALRSHSSIPVRESPRKRWRDSWVIAAVAVLVPLMVAAIVAAKRRGRSSTV